MTGEEIRARLTAFAARWSVSEGGEREAQTFRNELFECYGTHRQDLATFEEPQQGHSAIAAGERTYDPFAYLMAVSGSVA